MIRTLQGKLFASTAAVLAGFLGLSLTSVEVLTRRFAERSIDRELSTARAAVVRYLSLREDVLVARARTVAQTPFLKATLTIDTLDQATAFDTVRQLSVISETPLLLLFDADGRLLADASDDGATASGVSSVPLIERAFQGNDGPGIWMYGATPYLAAASLVLVGDHAAGAVLVGLPIDGDFAQDVRRVTDASVLLVNHSAVVARSGDARLPDVASPDMARFLAALRGPSAAGTVAVPFDTSLRAVSTRGADPISIVLIRGISDVLLLSQQQRWWLLAATFVSALVALIASRVVASRLGRPISLLTQASEAFGSGDFTVVVPERGEDELGVLSAGFNRMTTRIRRLMEESQSHVEVLRAQRQELEHARDAAQAANRAKSAFLASMSHELRTPLNAVIGYSELLIEEATDRGDGDLVTNLHRIRTPGHHLLSLVNEVLDLAKVEAGRETVLAEPVDLDELVRESVTALTPMAAASGTVLTIEIPEPVGTVTTDAKKLRQVLYNLLGNACKFTHGGHVCVFAGRVPDSDRVRVSVTDSGIGVPPDRLESIFEPFSQADNSTSRRFGGTGLGLAIGRSYCKLLGGSLTAVSTPGKGSTFTATFATHLRSTDVLTSPAA